MGDEVDDRHRVMQLWQALVGHRLSTQRAQEFLLRHEVAKLAQHNDAVLRSAARRAMRRGKGNLLLAIWVAEASEPWNKARQKAALAPAPWVESDDDFREPDMAESDDSDDSDTRNGLRTFRTSGRHSST